MPPSIAASYPVRASGATKPETVTLPATTGKVMLVCFGSNDGNPNLPSITDSGFSKSVAWTSIDSFTDTNGYSGQVWYCITSGALAGTETVSIDSTTSTQRANVIFALTNYSTILGNHAHSDSIAATGAQDVAITSTATSLILWWSFTYQGGFNAASLCTGSTLDTSDHVADGWNWGHATGGSTPVGYTDSGQSFAGAMAVEILIAPVTPTTVRPSLPDSFMRPWWNPDRNWVVKPPGTNTQLVIVPKAPVPPMLPEARLIPWVREATVTVKPPGTQATLVIVPKAPVPPVAPEFNARPIWNPERTAISWGPYTNIVPPSPVPPLDPDGFMRPIWNPERNATIWGPYTNILPGAPIPPVLPERPRYPWDPPRGTYTTVTAPNNLLVIVPVAPVPPVGPEFFLRPIWNPERSLLAWGPYTNIIPVDPVPASLPDYYLRRAWNPERTATVLPPGTDSDLHTFFGPWPLLPESYLRPAWNPERTGTVWAPWLFVPFSIYIPPTLPEFFARPWWNPERSALVKPPGRNQELVIVPGAPVPPGLPEGFLRFPWRPERSLSARYITQPPPVPAYASPPMLPERWIRVPWVPTRSWSYVPVAVETTYSLLIPSPVYAGVPFTATLLIENRNPRDIVVRSVSPRFVPEDTSGAIGQPVLPDAASLPHPWDSLWVATRWFRAPAASTARLQIPVVVFDSGPAILAADLETGTSISQVAQRRTTARQVPWAVVNVLPVGS